MATYRSALGKQVDMASLAAKNEKVRAVGNMKVNARGDTIDSTGKIIVPATRKVAENYAKTVGNRSAQPTSGRVAPKRGSPTPVARPLAVREELTAEERELEDSLDDDLEVEKIRAKERK